jgi:hypothetical protein
VSGKVVTILIQPLVTAVIYTEVWRQAVHYVLTVLVALLPTKIPDFAEMGVRLNPALARIPKDLEGSPKDVRIRMSRWGEYFDRVMKKPADYGITNTTDQCAGRALFGEDSTPCGMPDAFFYFHSGHPSTAVHRIVARGLEREVAQLFP